MTDAVKVIVVCAFSSFIRALFLYEAIKLKEEGESVAFEPWSSSSPLPFASSCRIPCTLEATTVGVGGGFGLRPSSAHSHSTK